MIIIIIKCTNKREAEYSLKRERKFLKFKTHEPQTDMCHGNEWKTYPLPLSLGSLLQQNISFKAGIFLISHSLWHWKRKEKKGKGNPFFSAQHSPPTITLPTSQQAKKMHRDSKTENGKRTKKTLVVTAFNLAENDSWCGDGDSWCISRWNRGFAAVVVVSDVLLWRCGVCSFCLSVFLFLLWLYCSRWIVVVLVRWVLVMIKWSWGCCCFLKIYYRFATQTNSLLFLCFRFNFYVVEILFFLWLIRYSSHSCNPFGSIYIINMNMSLLSP